MLCSWARHLTLTEPLSTQVYKWVPANLMLGVTLRWISIPLGGGGGGGGGRNTPSRFTLRKLRPDWPPGSYADLNFFFTFTACACAFEKFSLNLLSLSFVIRVDLLHP